MAETIDQLRKDFSWTQGKSDADIVFALSQRTGHSPDVIADQLGLKPDDYVQNDPGFVTSLKNSAYSLAGGAGQLIRDTGAPNLQGVGQAVQQFGDIGQYRNPVTVFDGDQGSAMANFGSNLLNHPLNTAGQVAGQALGLMIPGEAAKLGLGAYRTLRGAGAAADLVAGAQKASALQRAGGMAAEGAYYGLPQYEQTRQAQIAGGHGDDAGAVPLALGTSFLSGLVEGEFGPQSLMARGKILPWEEGVGKTMLRTMGKSALAEGGEELVQNPLQAIGSYQDPTSQDNLDQTGAQMLAGALGGATLGGAMHHFMKRAQMASGGPVDLTDTGSGATTAAQQMDIFGNYGAPAQYDPNAPVTGDNTDGPSWKTLKAGGQQDFLTQLDQSLRPDYVATRPVGMGGTVFNQMPITDDAYRQPTPSLEDKPNVTTPLPANLGDAIGVLRSVGNAPVIVGTPLHDAVTAASQILQQHGAKAPPVNEVTPEQAQEEQPAPIAVARQVAVDNGVSPKAWGHFVSKYSLKDAAPDEIAAALRDRAVNGAAGKTDAWEAAHAAITGKTITQYLNEGEQNGQSVPAEAGQVRPAQVQEQQAREAGVGQGAQGGNEGAPVQAGAQVGSVAVPSSSAMSGAIPAPVAAQAFSSAVSVPKLAPQQQSVFDLLKTAAQNNELDKYVGSDGTFQYQAIADSLGIQRQSARKAINSVKAKIDQHFGGNVAEFLRQRTAAQRATEAHDTDTLGMSPAAQRSVMDERDLMGSESGATPGMGEIASVGGSQSDVGESVHPPGYTDSVAPSEKAAAEARNNRREFVREAFQHPEAKNAAVDWDDMKSDDAPAFRDMDPYDQAGWIMEYVHSLQTGEFKSIEDAQRFYQEDLKNGSEALAQNGAERLDGPDRGAEGPAAQAEPGAQRRLGQPAGNTQEADREVSAAARRGESAGAGATPSAADGGTRGGETDVAAQPIERRVADLRGRLTEAQNKTLDRLIARFQAGDIDLGRFDTELSALEARTQPLESAGEAASGQDADTVRQYLRKLMVNPALFDRRVTVVQNESEVPEQFKRSQSTSKSTRLGFYDPRTGRMWLIADNIPKGRALSVFLHEAGVHMGMRNLLGKVNYDRLVGQIKTWEGVSGTVEGALARRAMRRITDAETAVGQPMDTVRRDDELIAYFVEEAVRAGINPTALSTQPKTMVQWFNTLWQAVKSAVQKLGMDPGKLTAKDVVDLAYGAARMELSGSHTDMEAANEASGRPMNEPAFHDAEALDSIDAQRAGAIDNKVSRITREAVSDASTNFVGKAKEISLGWMSLSQLREVASRIGKELGAAVSGFKKAVDAIQTESKHWIDRASKVDRMWSQLKPHEADRLSDVMRQARRIGFDPDVDEAKDPDQQMLKARFDAMTPGAQEVYRSARDFYAQAMEDRSKFMQGAIERAYAERLKEAKDAGDTARVKTLEASQARAEKDWHDMATQARGPYFPLMRLGNWYSVGMTKELAALTEKNDAGEATAEDKKQIAKLRQDSSHYIVQSHETEAQAKRAAETLANKFPTSRYNQAREFHRETMSLSASSLEEVSHYISTEFDSETRAKIHDMMAELYFNSLPEHHALKRQMRAELIHGEDENMRRVFSKSAISEAHYISHLKHLEPMREALYKVRQEGRHSVEARRMEKVIDRHTALMMSTERENPVANALVNVSYFAHLGVNPAFWLTNATQVPMIAMPWLAARHGGLARAVGSIRQAYTDAFRMIKSSYEQQGINARLDWASLAKDDEKNMLNTLLERNLLDVTIEHDMRAVADGSHTKMTEFIRHLNLPVHATELMNRTVTALAAYRLARGKGMTESAATEHAIKAVEETQFDYSALNSPLYMKSVMGSKALARIVMQFRKYQQAMLWLVGRSMYDAVKGADLETRNMARGTLMYLAMTSGTMAGALGLPLMSSVGWIANMIAQIFGAPDDKWDFETWLRNTLTDAVGPDAALALAKGIPAAFGVDMSQRVGMQDIASPLPFMRQGKNNDGATVVGNTLAALGGAPIGTIADTVDGINYMSDGQWIKGAEKLVPLKAAKDMMRAYRYSSEGLTSKNGSVMMDPDQFDAWDLALRATGFSPTTETEHYAAQSAMMDAKTAAMDVRTRLLRDYALARAGDGDVGDVEDQIADFNERHPERGVRITVSNKLSAVRTRMQQAGQLNGRGVRVGKGDAGFAEQARFADE